MCVGFFLKQVGSAHGQSNSAVIPLSPPLLEFYSYSNHSFSFSKPATLSEPQLCSATSPSNTQSSLQNIYNTFFHLLLPVVFACI